MNATTLTRRLTPATLVILTAALALAALMMFCNFQRAAATTETTPNVEAILNPAMHLFNEGFDAGSPINRMYADNTDGVHAYGEGIVTRASDGYTWTLSMDNDQAFLSPLSDLYVISNGAITETWSMTVTNSISTSIIHNDAFFTVNLLSPSEVQANIPFTVEMSITNYGKSDGLVSLRAPWGYCLDKMMASDEIFTLQEQMVFTNTGTYDLAAMISWDEYRLQDYNQIVVSDQIVPVTWVQIAGPTTGTVGETITITAMTNITATNQISYWFTIEDLGQIQFFGPSLKVEQPLVWQTPGEKTVSVEATNIAGNVVTDTMTVTITSPLPTVYQVFLPLTFNNYTAPTVVDKGEVQLTAGQGWTNPEQEDMLFGLFALNDSFLSISVDNYDAQVSCNAEKLTLTDDDHNGIFDTGCSSSTPWTIEIKVGNIIERWHVTIAP